jgi:MinD superfamily P-loop ATPase
LRRRRGRSAIGCPVIASITICINKADLNLEVTAQIEAEATRLGIVVLGRIYYDESVTAAQVKRITVVENGDGPAATDIRALWERVKNAMGLEIQ